MPSSTSSRIFWASSSEISVIGSISSSSVTTVCLENTTKLPVSRSKRAPKSSLLRRYFLDAAAYASSTAWMMTSGSIPFSRPICSMV
jgi:hypothetical protein